jgi:putative Mg2+ transporter-C (MgtC) family protein
MLEHFFSDMTLSSVAVRLLAAAILGGLVGMERAHKRYAAGIRTFALVCLGAALATITGIYLYDIAGDAADIGRIPAGIVSGIGFLGAGTILITDRKQIRGLTTAAELWVTSTIGMAIGAGFMWAALTCVILVLLTTYGLHYISRYVENHTRTIEIYVEIEGAKVKALLNYLRTQGYLVISMERRSEPTIEDGDIALRLELDLRKRYYHPQLLDDIMGVEGVHYIE